MGTTEQILTRQHAEFHFKNNVVEYFSISTQWDTADTIDKAIKNILRADKKYNGKAPIAHWMEKSGINYEKVSYEELERIVDIFNSIPTINPMSPKELKQALERYENEQ